MELKNGNDGLVGLQIVVTVNCTLQIANKLAL